MTKEDKIIHGISTIDFLEMIMDEQGSQHGKFILTLRLLEKASHVTYTTIRYCEQHLLVVMAPLDNSAYEFNLTKRGLMYLNSNKVKS